MEKPKYSKNQKKKFLQAMVNSIKENVDSIKRDLEGIQNQITAIETIVENLDD